MKRFLSFFICVALLVSLCGCRNQGEENAISELINEYEKIESFANEDYVYHPSAESVAFDAEENLVYFNDLLIVYTFADFNKEEADELARTVDGIVVGEISGSINAIQIQVQATDLDGLNAKAEALMRSDDVLYAGYDYPIEVTNNNSWSDDRNNPESDLNNEENPNGNDWWAEAVGAYTAWNSIDSTEKNKVGILDSGFDVDHEDLQGKITFLDEYRDNSEDDHGTHVAGIIAANNNEVGVRGIADNAELICVDWSPITNDNKSNDYVNYLSTGEYIEIIKQLIDNDVRVINNSWGTHVCSKEGYTEALYGESNDFMFLLQYFAVHSTGSYESYLEYIDVRAKRTALESMLVIVQLMLNDKEDFLIVQSAGNGYDNGGKGHNVSRNGFFCSIDNGCYNTLSESSREILENLNITYDEIKDHIMIVGAIQNSKDSNNNYLMTNFSNFGDNVDVCAPGQSIYSTVVNNEYKSLNGTSMAAPIVSGSAALLWSVNPELTAGEVKQTLIDTAIAKASGVGDGAGKTYPVVNVGNALYSVFQNTAFSVNKDNILGNGTNAVGCDDGTYYWTYSESNVNPEYTLVFENNNGDIKELYKGANRGEIYLLDDTLTINQHLYGPETSYTPQYSVVVLSAEGELIKEIPDFLVEDIDESKDYYVLRNYYHTDLYDTSYYIYSIDDSSFAPAPWSDEDVHFVNANNGIVYYYVNTDDDRGVILYSYSVENECSEELSTSYIEYYGKGPGYGDSPCSIYHMQETENTIYYSCVYTAGSGNYIQRAKLFMYDKVNGKNIELTDDINEIRADFYVYIENGVEKVLCYNDNMNSNVIISDKGNSIETTDKYVQLIRKPYREDGTGVDVPHYLYLDDSGDNIQILPATSVDNADDYVIVYIENVCYTGEYTFYDINYHKLNPTPSSWRDHSITDKLETYRYNINTGETDLICSMKYE